MIGTTDYISIKLTDETQFRSIFDKYYISLCMFANQYVENDALAADIVQECFVKLWQLRDDFMYVHQIKSFLYTSVRNKSLNELEHTKVMNEYAQKVQEMSKDSFFQDKVIAEESYRILVDAIEKMIVKYARMYVPHKRITPHKLRSTFGTQLYQETGDLYLVAETLGHSSVDTSKKYASMKERKRLVAQTIQLRAQNRES